MKIAVLNINGIQNTQEGQLVYYFRVEDDYDFTGNSATDVTSFDMVDLFIKTNRISYIEYRKWLINFNSISTFSNLTQYQKEILSKNFATNKTNRNSVFSESEQSDFAILMQESIYKANKERNFTLQSSQYLSNTNAVSDINTHFSEKFNLITTNASGAWVLRDVSDGVTCPSNSTMQILIINSSTGNRNIGARQVGSNINRYITIAKNSSITLMVNVNSLQQIEIYSNGNGVVFYEMGCIQ